MDVIVLIATFWKETDPAGNVNEQTQFLKDLGLAGGALFLFVVVSELGTDLGLTIIGPLFDGG
ncbi:MAG: hypothetical protein H0U35_07745 [Sporichthyaceae bacterium]|nr:hypothetical protein [Sporichthyaceae bacterium]